MNASSAAGLAHCFSICSVKPSVESYRQHSISIVISIGNFGLPWASRVNRSAIDSPSGPPRRAWPNATKSIPAGAVNPASPATKFGSVDDVRSPEVIAASASRLSSAVPLDVAQPPRSRAAAAKMKLGRAATITRPKRSRRPAGNSSPAPSRCAPNCVRVWPAGLQV